MAEVVEKVDHRSLVEKTNYFKKRHINNTRQWEISFKKSWTFFYIYMFLFAIFLFFLYQQYNDFKLIFKTPILYIWLFIFILWLYLLTKWKTTLKWVKPVYEIISDFFSILKDNWLKKYNKKNRVCNNELKVIKISLN